MREIRPQEIREKIGEYDKIIKLVEDSRDEIDYQEKIAGSILEELLNQYKSEEMFCKKLFILQQSMQEAKYYKDTMLREVGDELKTNRNRLKREQSDYEEERAWD